MPELTNATVQGPVSKVPCAHCGQPMDLTELIDDIAKGTSITCDVCEKNSEVVDIRKVVVVRQT